MLKHIKGNLIDLAEAGRFNLIIHGCNCHNTMGNGIAKEIKRRYPAAFEADQLTVKGCYNKLGNYSVMLGKQFDIINAYTQFGYNKVGARTDLFEYVAFELILEKLAYKYPRCHMGVPYIGMGLAGGDRQRIMSMLDSFSNNIDSTGGSVTLVEFA